MLGWTPDKDNLIELAAGKEDGESRYAGRSMDGFQFRRESLGTRFEKSNIGEVFQKFEVNVYYNYADHIMDNYSLRPPYGGMSAGMTDGGMGDAMDAGISMDMSMPMVMEVDRRTVGARMRGSWEWADVELKSGTDAQLNTHCNKMDNSLFNDARFHVYGLFSELTWNTTESGKVVGGARLDRVLVDNFPLKVPQSGRIPFLPGLYV